MDRYDWTPKFMGKLSTGSYVLYTDHIAVIGEKDDEITALRERLRVVEEALSGITTIADLLIKEGSVFGSGSLQGWVIIAKQAIEKGEKP